LFYPGNFAGLIYLLLFVKIINNRHCSFCAGKTIAVSFVFTCFFLCPLFSQNETNKADSIIIQALKHRELYGRHIQSYEAEVYMRGNSTINKKNILVRYAPDFLYRDRKGNNHFTETFIQIRFNAPNLFTQQIKAINGTHSNTQDIQNRVMQFLNVNIYNPTLFNDLVMLPEIKNIHRYYHFEYVESMDTLGYSMHKIKIMPQIKSQKLISGYFIIVDKLWTIFSFDITGRYRFSNFRIETEFGMPDHNFLLPQNIRITFETKLLGNFIVSRYFSSFQYTSIVKQEQESRGKKPDYDLSDYFNIQTDSLPLVKDSAYWAENRPSPLSKEEISLYEQEIQTQKKENFFSFSNESWNFYQRFFTPRRFYYNSALFNYSGLLNPLKLAYSKNNGVTYWQQLRLNKNYGNGQEVIFSPNAGFLFQRKEFYFSAPTQWLFQPRKFGKIYFTVGNRNQAYNSIIIEKINMATPDSINFDNFNIEYYHHFYWELKAEYEITNGLLLHGGIDFDWYNTVKSKSNASGGNPKETIKDGDIANLVDRYQAFSPSLEVVWTPGQYYRMSGKKKEYVGSYYPTFSLNYARGIKDIWKSNSNYERIEIDAQQKIPAGLMNSFQYYLGAGCFTKTNAIYFADFRNFQNHHFPRSWNDPIGGVFHLLNSEWYNASNSYIQAHFMYESPFFFLKLFKGITRDILSERIYISQLYTPALPCYTEIGFGIGNFMVNAGAFISLNRGKYQSFGVKAVFELNSNISPKYVIL
jgi:hypothetical protein